MLIGSSGAIHFRRRSDQAIREDVIFELNFDPEITSKDIAVAVHDAVVTLSGYCPSYAKAARRRAYFR
jgi:osmotically-inducible protein OsmY